MRRGRAVCLRGTPIVEDIPILRIALRALKLHQTSPYCYPRRTEQIEPSSNLDGTAKGSTDYGPSK